MEKIIEAIDKLNRSEKTELACHILSERLIDYGLTLEALGLGDAVLGLQNDGYELAYSKELLCARIDEIPTDDIRQYVNRINIEMQ